MYSSIADIPIGHQTYNPATGLAIQIFGFSFWILVVLCFCYNLCSGRWIPANRRYGNERRKRQGPTLGEQLARMLPEDRKVYFRNLFDKNGNQLTLEADHIISERDCGTTRSAFEGENATHDCELAQDENDSEHGFYSIRLSLNQFPEATASATASATATATAAGERKSGKDSNHATRMIVSNGKCVICFDVFRAGDIVVYSTTPTCTDGSPPASSREPASTEHKDEATRASPSSSSPSPSSSSSSSSSSTAAYPTQSPNDPVSTATEEAAPCSHLFHKECMIDYLSKRKISPAALRNGLGDRPKCPICRKTFCELLPIQSVIGNVRVDNEDIINHYNQIHETTAADWEHTERSSSGSSSSSSSSNSSSDEDALHMGDLVEGYATRSTDHNTRSGATDAGECIRMPEEGIDDIESQETA